MSVLSLTKPTNQSRAQAVSLFSPKLEKLSLTTGIVLTLAAVLVPFLFRAANAPVEPIYLVNFLVQILLMNITHNAFSFMLPLVSPEVRAWWQESRYLGMKTTSFVLLLFGITFASVFSLSLLMENKNYSLPAYAIYTFLELILTKRHGLGQVFGLARIYDQRAQQQFGAADKKTQRSQDWQRRLMVALLLLSIPRLMISAIGYESATAIALMTPLSIVMVFIVTAIVLLAYAETHGRFSNKYLFLMRLAVLPFTSFTNPWPLFALMALHGIEHAMVTFTMTRNSYLRTEQATNFESRPAPRRYWGWAIALLLSVLVLVHFRDFMLGAQLRQSLSAHLTLCNFLVSLSASISLCHFFLDEMMFKMRRSEVRKHIAPLLDIPAA